MLLKSIKAKTTFILLILGFSFCYPLTQKTARGLAVAAGVGVGLTFDGIALATFKGKITKRPPTSNPADVTAKNILNDDQYDEGVLTPETFKMGAEEVLQKRYQLVTGVGLGLMTYYITYKYLARYTPQSKLKYIREILKKISQNSEYAQHARKFLALNQDDESQKQLLEIFGEQSNKESVINQLKIALTELTQIYKQLDLIKKDINDKKLLESYEKTKNKAALLKSYIAIALAATDGLTKQEFKHYTEFGTDGRPDIDEAINHFTSINNHLNEAESYLDHLTGTQDMFCKPVYPLNGFLKTTKFLKNVAALRLAQTRTLSVEKILETDPIFTRLSNPNPQTSWPLVATKQKLDKKLEELKQSYQSVNQILSSFEQNQEEYKEQTKTLLDKLPPLINVVESELQHIVKREDYSHQLQLYENNKDKRFFAVVTVV